jgi:hypothetical protein
MIKLLIFLVVLITNNAICVFSVPIPESCKRNPRSCVAPSLAVAIDRLRPIFEQDDEHTERVTADDPFRCLLFARRTVPRGNKCISCEHPVFGCQAHHNRGPQWDEVCALFCLPTVSDEVSSPEVRVESESETIMGGRLENGKTSEENAISRSTGRRVPVDAPRIEGRPPPTAKMERQQREYEKANVSTEESWPMWLGIGLAIVLVCFVIFLVFKINFSLVRREQDYTFIDNIHPPRFPEKF